MRTLSLRARLTIWYTIALLIVLSVFGASVLWQQRRIGIRRVDRELAGLSTTLANIVRDELNEKDTPAVAAAEATSTVTAPGRALAVIGANGTVLAARWNGLVLREPLPGRASLPQSSWSARGTRTALRRRRSWTRTASARSASRKQPLQTPISSTAKASSWSQML